MHPQLTVEARPTEAIGLKLPPALLQQIDDLAEAQQATRSAIARAAIRIGMLQLQQEVG